MTRERYFVFLSPQKSISIKQEEKITHILHEYCALNDSARPSCGFSREQEKNIKNKFFLFSCPQSISNSHVKRITVEIVTDEMICLHLVIFLRIMK